MSTSSTTPPPTAAEVPRRATHDFGDGTRIEAAFFDSGDQALFGMTHLPQSPNGHGVLICSPIYNDYLKNNRREVLLGRMLADRGFTVQRFNYAGTSNSDGEIADLTMDTMMADSDAAADALSSRDGVDTVSYMGTRMGALPAARLADRDQAPLALWEPTDGTRYFRELFRTMAIIEMDSDGGGATVTELKTAFERDRTMDAAGYVVGWPFYESSDRNLVDTVGSGSAPVLLAQFRDKPELKAEFAKLTAAWEGHGRPVTTHFVLVDEAWMLFVYGFRPEEDREHSMTLITTTADWFGGQL